MTFKLHPDTTIGTVSLNIRDMKRSLDFYVDKLGFQVHRQAGQVAYLGVGEKDLLILNENPNAPTIEMNAGLFHFAILVPSRLDLAKSLHRIALTNTPIQGASDHLVSEALYMADPDGIGIEIYRDRSQNEWTQKNGHLNIDTLPLDLQDILNQLSPEDMDWQGLPAGTTIGHVHLNTGRNTELSKRFYIDQLGFDMVMSVGGYWHFIATGGYHHHLGLRPAGIRQNQESVGLRWYSLEFADETALNTTITQLEATGVDVSETEDGYHFYDHANNGVLLTTA